MSKFAFFSSLSSVVLHTVLSVLDFTKGNWELGIVFAFLSFLSAFNMLMVFYPKLNIFAHSTLLLMIAGVVAILYAFLPNFLTTLATIFGVASFVYLMIERVLED